MAQACASGQRERVRHPHHRSQGEEYINIELSLLRDAQSELAFFVEKMALLHTAARHGARRNG